MRADDNDELHAILRDFLEPDTNDKKIHGGAVIRTVNTSDFGMILRTQTKKTWRIESNKNETKRRREYLI